MSDDKSAREFWIDNTWTSLDSNPPFISAPAYTEKRDDCTHVIEYSAVEALEKQNAELKQKIEIAMATLSLINKGPFEKARNEPWALWYSEQAMSAIYKINGEEVW